MNICILSPHIDDAALSCGGFLNYLKKNDKNFIHIINVFCGMYDDQRQISINIDRTFEERNVLHNGKFTYLSLPDISQRLSTFSWDRAFMKKGQLIDTLFLQEMNKIKIKIEQYLNPEHYDIVLFPIGYGDHKDHVLLSLLGRKYSATNNNILFYRDLPYIDKGEWCKGKFSPIFEVIFDLQNKIKLLKNYEQGIQVGDDLLSTLIDFHNGISGCRETLYEYNID